MCDYFFLYATAGDLRTDTVSDEEETETYEKYSTYLKMIGVDPSEDKTQIAKKVEAFEAEAKRKFVDEPANMKLLIVVDKLLTGFDAPSCTSTSIRRCMTTACSRRSAESIVWMARAKTLAIL